MFKKEIKVKLTKEEIERLKEVAKEYNKLKRCLGVVQSEWDYDTKTHNLIQNLSTDNTVVKEMSIIARKVDMILDHLGLKYVDAPSLLKMKKCVETE